MFEVSDQDKKRFAGLYLLEYMVNEPKSFSLFLERNDQDLEPVLEWLLVQDYVSVEDEERYVANQNGRNALEAFLKRYSEFLTIFDVFCAVDLQAGEFAFARYFELTNPEEWRQYLDQDRWEDLRVPVAAFKGIDPVEIVFMSFIQEKRFGRDESGWQFDLLLGSVWDEILAICNSALKLGQLGYEDEQGVVSGEAVISDVISQGLELVDHLHKQEVDFRSELGAGGYRSQAGNFTPQVDPVPLVPPDQHTLDQYKDPHYRPEGWQHN